MKKTITYLIALVVLMITSLGASAQSGLSPLVGSTHTYSITAGGANTYAWTVLEGTPGTEYVLSNGTTTTASILWKTAGTYTLQFTETNATTLCNTVVQNTVVVGNNTFDVTTPAILAAICNEASGVPNFGTATVATTVQFAVNMATGISAFNPNWEFTFTLTPSASTSIGTVTTSAGSITGPVAGVYTVTGATSALDVGSATISLEFTGDVLTANTVAIAITSAKELTYNTPSNNLGNKTATQTVNAIPNTTGFSSN